MTLPAITGKAVRDLGIEMEGLQNELQMISCLMKGTGAMRDAGKTYLPQWPNEDNDSYAARLQTATLYPIFRRTVIVNAARPFSRPVTMEKIPEAMKEWLDNIDLQGSSLPAFGVALMEKCLSDGLVGVLTDYPQAENIKTVEDEKKAGVRPYLTIYPAASILGWRATVENGNTVLKQVRLLEVVTVDDGDFGSKEVEQVRVLQPGEWATYQKDEKPNEKGEETWKQVGAGTTTIKVIPFEFYYGVREKFGVGRSPLLDLGYMNVKHWQSESDQQTILHVARVPVLFAKCFGDQKITIGASTAASSDDENSTLEYVEHSGMAVGAGRQAIQDLEEQMRAIGAELIAQKPSHVTATQVTGESEATKSLLQQITEIFEESLEGSLNFMLQWVQESEQVDLDLYKDFDQDTGLDPQNLQKAVESKVLSRETYFNEMKRRDLVSPDLNWTDELGRIKQEMQTFEPAGTGGVPGTVPASSGAPTTPPSS